MGKEIETRRFYRVGVPEAVIPDVTVPSLSKFMKFHLDGCLNVSTTQRSLGPVYASFLGIIGQFCQADAGGSSSLAAFQVRLSSVDGHEQLSTEMSLIMEASNWQGL